MNVKEITALSNGRKTTVFVCHIDGGAWYTQAGGSLVNFAYADLNENTDIEMLIDADCFSCSPINDLEDFEAHLESYYYG